MNFINVPLHDEIYSKFQPYYPNMTIIQNENGIYFYKYDPWVNGPNSLLSYDIKSDQFWYNNTYYTVDDFKKVLKLLVFI